MKDLDFSDAGFGDPGGWWPCTYLGAGDLDPRGVLEELRSVGFAGLICVELATLPARSDEDRMMAESVAWLRRSIRQTGIAKDRLPVVHPRTARLTGTSNM